MTRTNGRKARRLLLVFAANLAGLVACALLLEGGLRLADRVLDWHPVPFTYQIGRWYGPGPDGVKVILPDAHLVHVTDCYRAEYTSNHFGAKDRARSLDASGFRIAFLGDSFTEGLGVSNAELFPALLEDRYFDGAVEFLNFGVTGYGTTEAYLLYQHQVRRFHPDLVVLMFFAWNDLTDNSHWYAERGYERPTRPYFVRDADGGWALIPPAEPGSDLTTGARERKNRWLRSSHLYRLLDHLADELRKDLSTTEEGKIDQLYKLYDTEPDPDWAESWAATEHVLAELDRAVRADGGRLLVVDVPTPYLYSDRWVERRITSQPGRSVAAPSERLAAIARRHGIGYFDLYPPLRAIVEERGLEEPYLSHSCDHHWSPAGHAAVASVLAPELAPSR